MNNLLTPFHLNVLKQLYLSLKATDIVWAVTGSTNHALQGIAIIPRDIDILTNKTGAYRIEELFQDFVVRNASYRVESTIRSYFGILCVKGIQIEIIGDIENQLDNGKWEPHVDWEKHIEYLTINDFIVPVLSLEYELQIYKKLHQHHRVKLLRQKIECEQ